MLFGIGPVTMANVTVSKWDKVQRVKVEREIKQRATTIGVRKRDHE